MNLWSRSHSLQQKIIAAIVMVGLLPLTLLLALIYIEERRALRESTGANFKEVAVEAARRIEMHITRGMNEAQQLATAPFLRTAVLEANRTYEGKDAQSISDIIKDWQLRWGQRDKRSEFPLFVNRIVTNYLIRWHEIRKSDYVGILVTDGQGALVVSSIPQVEYSYAKTVWWQAVVKGGSQRPYVGEIAFDPAFGTHVVVVAAPILDDQRRAVVGTVTILLRRDTLFQSIGEGLFGATGHAMLFASDGGVVICPVLAPEAHSIDAELLVTLGSSKPAGPDRVCTGAVCRSACERQSRWETLDYGGAARSIGNLRPVGRADGQGLVIRPDGVGCPLGNRSDRSPPHRSADSGVA
jgi:hypothetical protein